MATTAGNYRRSDGLVRIHPPRELAAAAFELYETFRNQRRGEQFHLQVVGSDRRHGHACQ
jgi:hypothetical protein